MTTEDKTRVISLRLGDELLEKLEKKAVDDAVSRNAVIVQMLEEWFRGFENQRLVVNLPMAPVSPAVSPRVKLDAVSDGRGKISIEVPEKSPVGGHDPKTCRIYKCGMCAVMKGEK